MSQPIQTNTSLDDLLAELSEEPGEVTFSQIIVQFLKLNSRFEHTSVILNIIVTIVNKIIIIIINIINFIFLNNLNL
jgi:hypothetical protein